MIQVAAQAGQTVTIVDLQPELLEKAQKSIQSNLGRVAKKLYKDDAAKAQSFVAESSERIKVSTKIEDGVNADLIVEAIVEKLDVKQELFNKLDQVTHLTIPLSLIPIHVRPAPFEEDNLLFCQTVRRTID